MIADLIGRARRSVVACGSSIALVGAIGLGSISLAAASPPARPTASSGIERLLATASAMPTTPRVAASRASRSVRVVAFRGRDGRRITEARIRRFLRQRGSPMARYSDEILAAGIRYRVDPRVVVAIAGVESTYGVYARGHNAWGWGRARWGSWGSAIRSYARALAREYPSLRMGHFRRAGPRYCPPCGGRWAAKASRIFRSI